VRLTLRALTGLLALAMQLQSPVSAGAWGGMPAAWNTVVDSPGSPLFYQAGGIAVGGSGNIFIADEGDHRVLKLAPSGSRLATWGTDRPGPLRFDGPRSIAVDSAGNIYLADNGVVKLRSDGRFLSRWTGGVLSYPRGLAVDASRNVYVLSLHPVPYGPLFDRITITKLAPSGQKLVSWVYSYPQPAGDAALGAAIATTSQGNLLLSIAAQRFCHSCDGTYHLLRTVSPSGKTLSEVNEDVGGQSVAVDRAGDVYLAAPGKVEKLSPTGSLLATLGVPGCGPGQLGPDLYLAVSPGGVVTIADSQVVAVRPDGIPAPFRNGVVHTFAADGTAQSLLGTCPSPGARTTFGQINALAMAPGGNMYVADGILSKIVRVGPQGTVLGGFSADHPSTVATDTSGNVYVPAPAQAALDKLAPDGRLLARTSGVGLDAVAIARSGQVYGLSSGQVLVLPPVGHGSRPIRSWWLNGYGPGTGGLNPEGMAFDGRGNLWVADIRHNNIQEYSAAGKLLLIFGRGGSAPGRFHTPGALTLDGRGHLWVADSGNNRVQELDLRGRFIAAYGREGQAPGQFQQPEGIGADARGNIYVGDRGNDRIQELVLR